MDDKDKRASFSNFGVCVNLFAPGVEIQSTYKDGKTKWLDGTSMSSPMVAGALAVLLSERKFENVKEGTRVFLEGMSVNRLKGVKDSPNVMLFSGMDAVKDVFSGVVDDGRRYPGRDREPAPKRNRNGNARNGEVMNGDVSPRSESENGDIVTIKLKGVQRSPMKAPRKKPERSIDEMDIDRDFMDLEYENDSMEE